MVRFAAMAALTCPNSSGKLLRVRVDSAKPFAHRARSSERAAPHTSA
jgi:hypothetical protein